MKRNIKLTLNAPIFQYKLYSNYRNFPLYALKYFYVSKKNILYCINFRYYAYTFNKLWYNFILFMKFIRFSIEVIDEM